MAPEARLSVRVPRDRDAGVVREVDPVANQGAQRLSSPGPGLLTVRCVGRGVSCALDSACSLAAPTGPCGGGKDGALPGAAARPAAPAVDAPELGQDTRPAALRARQGHGFTSGAHEAGSKARCRGAVSSQHSCRPSSTRDADTATRHGPRRSSASYFATRACLHKLSVVVGDYWAHVSNPSVDRRAVGTDLAADAVFGWQAGQAFSGSPAGGRGDHLPVPHRDRLA